jgi:hypothetical protein
VQYRYYSKRMQMTANLKRVAHAVRERRPEYFAQREIQVVEKNEEGHVVSSLRKDAKATSLSPRARHALAMKKD